MVEESTLMPATNVCWIASAWILAAALAGVSGCSAPSSAALAKEVDEYCQRLPAGYPWLIRHAEQENYSTLYESWTGRETGGDLHTYFTFCTHVRRDPAAVDVHLDYVETVANPVSVLLVQAIAAPEGFTEEKQEELVRKLRLAEALAKELVAMPLK
jgi:hypothetical protein